ncbi:protein farnesyltransferase/geranylgeranyltransferase type-1 subunit alpha [Eupeodes corollae]|uniref:protein farnesyltransferase/geranylgeranyltransferase type-1 subunit alpha n=1 Tax=Eupeodes corollae TaxID=290404 RepID=UPI0024935468|nr:protein farnesyltransferase/geranylgeranyltransferase type-1 subunit alpha [Eupeodes corollae]
MSDSSDDDLYPEWVPYSKRKEWADVTPLAQDDGDYPVVAIAYSPKFREVYDYFRAILAKKEKSLRALGLIKDALRLNPANYTVWQYRRECLKDLNINLYDELDYIEFVIRDNPKNYQVWHHRRVIVEILMDPSNELGLTEAVLNMDAKNYHAWQHRQWVIRTYDLYENELTYVDKLIAEDIRNNSAWNQRFFVLRHFGFTPEVIQRELQYTMNRIRVVKNNESAWNFLRGLLKQSDGTLGQHSEVVDFIVELYANGSRSPYLVAFLIELYEEKCLQSVDDTSEQETYAKKVYSLCDDMSKKHDIIRRKYWQYIAERLHAKLEGRTP